MAHPAPVALKLCRGCQVEKPHGEFYKHPAGKHGLAPRCKEFAKATTRAGHKAPGAAVHARNLRLQRQYGLTLSDYEVMFTSQGGLCAICRQPERQDKILAVDHCHATGRVRGLLCMDCNTALGKLRDSPAILRAAAAYLEK